jgi:hypothetical protein
MRERHRPSLRSNLLLALISTVFCLLLGEVALRALFSPPQAETRFLFWSSPHFVLDAQDAVRYRPHETVREIAIYDGRIEYDARYRTNNLGLIDELDYHPNEAGRRIALVGDSFTAGSGAPPWIPALRGLLTSQQPGARLYNLGVAGAGIIHMVRLIESLAPTLAFDEIVILAITNDFHRPFWRPLTSDTEIRFCPMDESRTVCAKREPVATVIPYALGAAGLQASIAERTRARAAAALHHSPLTRTLRHSRVFALAHDLYRQQPIFAAGEKTQQVSDTLKRFVERDSEAALRQLRARFADTPIHLIHLPEKHEVAQGRYDRNLKPLADELGLRYTSALDRCDWSIDLFYPRDPHPNALGYQRIAHCAAGLLSAQPAN